MIKSWKTSLLLTACVFSLMTSGFSLWISYGNSNAQGNIIVDDATLSKDNYLTISIPQQENKTAFGQKLTNDGVYDRTKNYINFILKWDKKSHSSYSDDLLQYFDILDSNNYALDLSPSIYCYTTQESYYVDFSETNVSSHILKTGYYYDQGDVTTYDQIDTSKKNVGTQITLLDSNETITDNKAQVKFDSSDGTGFTDKKITINDNYTCAYLRQKKTTGTSSDSVYSILYVWFYSKLNRDSGIVRRIKYAKTYTVKSGTDVTFSKATKNANGSGVDTVSTGNKGLSSYIPMLVQYTGTDGKAKSEYPNLTTSVLSSRMPGNYYAHPTVYREIEENTLDYGAIKTAVTVSQITWNISLVFMIQGEQSMRTALVTSAKSFNTSTNKWNSSNGDITTPLGYSLADVAVVYENKRTQPYFVIRFKNGFGAEVKYRYDYNTGGLSPIGFTRLLNKTDSNVICYDYRIRLRPKSGYEEDARKIVSSFDYSLTHEVEEYLIP